jgi:hypothetical protein
MAQCLVPPDGRSLASPSTSRDRQYFWKIERATVTVAGAASSNMRVARSMNRAFVGIALKLQREKRERRKFNSTALLRRKIFYFRLRDLVARNLKD